MPNILHSQPINALGNGLESNRCPTPAPEYRRPANVALLLLKNEQGSNRVVASGRENANHGSPEKPQSCDTEKTTASDLSLPEKE